MKYKLKLDYTSDELKELRELRENHDSPMYAIRRIADIGNGSDKLKNLHIKYAAIDYADEFDFMADINNVVMGTAIFPEPKKYYVHFIKNDRNSYLNITLEDGHRVAELGSNPEISSLQKTKFTRDEVVAIDPRLVSFMEEVEDDE